MEIIEAFETLRAASDPGPRRPKIWPWSTSPGTQPVPEKEKLDEALATLAKSPAHKVMPELAGFVWKGSGRFSEELSLIFMDLAVRLPVSKWPQVDERIRAMLDRKGPERVFTAHPERAPQALLLVALCHSSGHVREQAVRLSGRLEPLLASILLFVRVNDWVGPVRTLATEKLAETFLRLSPVERFKLLPLLQRLRYCGRHDEKARLGKWTESIASNFDEDAWIVAWKSAAGREKRIYLDFLKMSGRTPAKATRSALLASNNRIALFWYIRSILPALESHERDQAVAIIRKSRIVALRREWLTFCLETLPSPEMQTLLRKTLLDRSRALRQFASFHLARISDIDIIAFYLEAMEDPATEAISLLELAMIAPALAHDMALERLYHVNPAVAVVAIASVSPESLADLLPVLMRLFDSPLPGVSGAAGKRLFEIRRLLGIELATRPELWAGFSIRAAESLVRMAPGFQKWDGLQVILSKLPDPRMPAVALGALQQWISRENRAFIKLDAVRRATLLELLLESALPPPLFDKLEFLLEKAP